MKSWITTILAILVFASSFQSSLVLVDYQINQEFYETHCENKNKPELSCHGKCQLNKETENKAGIYLVAKFCFEMNILPTETLKIAQTKPSIWEDKNDGFNLYIQPILPGYMDIIPHPPQI
ncbi:MAG: hypothetical protein JSS94_01330 [Bacteroidetes bacterium]|nr:hypothetical protein [Bacteroidota bacterium]